MNQRYVLRSRKASKNCGQLNFDTFVPVLFSLSRSRAINLRWWRQFVQT